MFSQEKYLKALTFAAKAHGDEKTINGLPYITHLASVAMEILHACEEGQIKVEDTDFAITLAFLHDILENTNTTFDDIADEFDDSMAVAVDSLTKDESITNKKQKMADSINRILTQNYIVQSVKLANRVSNLQSPPKSWDNDKIYSYYEESKFILSCLKNANAFLSKRLEDKINNYRIYIK